MDYRKSATEVLAAIGGSSNIASAAHCATRLRLVIVDNSKVDKKTLENVEGVKGVFEASGQLQIIYGTGTVDKVYDEFINVAGISGATKEEAKAAAAANINVFQRFIKTLGDIFVPIIPAIVASGFLMGIMNALDFMVKNGFLNINTSSSIYVFANLFSNIAYIFLPILIGYSSAGVFGGNSPESYRCMECRNSYRYSNSKRIFRTLENSDGGISGACYTYNDFGLGNVSD